MTKMERRSLGASFYMCRMREYAFRGGIYNTYKLQRNKNREIKIKFYMYNY